ncbi:DUF4347 domain-containing protein, partial [Pectobacterium fontis]|uniref:DUF4347 domain-containing protein n=1 Tax=Pectobacterium fontis TaxID=2558042 RepID=UPI0012B68310
MLWLHLFRNRHPSNKQHNTVPHAVTLTSNTPLGYALEARMLFDGAIAATADQTTTTQDSAAQTATAASHTENSTHQTDTSSDNAADDTTVAVASDPTTSSKDVVFIDTSVADYQTLLNQVPSGTEVVLLDSSADGLSQMTEWAKTHSGYDTIHIISHGSEGRLHLGAITLDSDNVASRQSDLSTLGAALTENGDILLYGCSVASGEGMSFINAIATATGADVAASSDLTGDTVKGGNWTLEQRVGSDAIQADALAFSDYNQLLTLVSFDSNDFSSNAATYTKPVTGIDITFSGVDGYSFANNLGSNYNVFPDSGSNSTGDGTRLTIAIASGYTFDLTSFSYRTSLEDTITLTFTYANNTTVTGTLTATANADITLSNFSVFLDASNNALSASANDVIKVVIASVNGFGAFDFGTNNFDISDVKAIVPSVNNAPIISNTTVSKTFNEDTSQTFSATDFGFSDVDSGDTLQSITIVAAPTAGELFIDVNGDGVRGVGDTLIGNGTVVTAANIDKLTFRPADNANGAGYAAFTWTVSDGTASSANVGTMTLNVTAVNDAPTDITLSATAFAQSLGSNGTVATLTATDVDSSAFTYSLVSGSGSTDNALFTISGNTLKAVNAATMAAGTYSVRLQVSDGAATYDKVVSLVVVDDIAPTFDQSPSVSNATAGGFKLSGSLTETGNVYYVVVADGASAPTATQVIAGQNAAGGVAPASGNQVLGSSPFDFNFTLTGLAASTAYDVYVVARDSAGNNTISVVKVDATTTSTANTPPTFSNLNGGSTYTENGSAVVIDSNVTVADVELDTLNSGLGNYNGASITLVRNGGTNSNDIFGNSGLLGALTQGQNFTYNGTAVGSVTTNANGTLVLTFNSNATSAIVDAVMQSLTYANSSDNPPSSVTLNWTFNDGSMNSVSSNQSVSTIIPVNDAPVVSGTTVTLTATTENAVSPTTAVSSLLSATGYADVDGGAVSGIALTALTGNGTWQYSTNSGADWFSIGAVSNSSALLLSSTTQIRYVPDGANSETATLGFRAWDQTSGTATSGATRGLADTSTTGGTSAFSTNSVQATLAVSNINDAPVISGTVPPQTLAQGGSLNFALPSGLF